MSQITSPGMIPVKIERPSPLGLDLTSSDDHFLMELNLTSLRVPSCSETCRYIDVMTIKITFFWSLGAVHRKSWIYEMISH
jgi:hypothetical protein